MRNELGHLIEVERQRRGLTLQALAGLLGYRNVNKGARRIERLERTGLTEDLLLDGVVRALGLDPAVVAEHRRIDAEARREAFERWLSEPQPMCLVRMIIPGVISEEPLPEGLDEAAAIEHVVTLAKARNERLCLVLDRRRSLWVGRDGHTLLTETTPDHPNRPYMTIG